MPKVKTSALLWVTALWFGVTALAYGQPVLGQVIDQTKQAKLRQIAPSVASKQGSEDVPAAPLPQLWSISGINGKLVAEVWQADAIYRLPLQKGVKLPSGWQVVGFDKQSVTFKLGNDRHKIPVVARGSTGWEYPQTPRLSSSASASASVSPTGRAAASNLPPAAMPSAPPSVR